MLSRCFLCSAGDACNYCVSSYNKRPLFAGDGTCALVCCSFVIRIEISRRSHHVYQQMRAFAEINPVCRYCTALYISYKIIIKVAKAAAGCFTANAAQCAPSTCFLWPTKVQIPNSISIGLAVFAGWLLSYRPTDRLTDHATWSVTVGRIYVRI